MISSPSATEVDDDFLVGRGSGNKPSHNDFDSLYPDPVAPVNQRALSLKLFHKVAKALWFIGIV